MYGDYLNEDGRKIRDAIFDMSVQVGMHRAIAIALEHINYGKMEAGTIERIASELRSPKSQDQQT